ncbi:helix-turn-helix transcriptional regulator [Blautia liquoris]|jgi:transcriptional regulator with XRE-family HTH domain|uniref:Helix-turn-helix transcriptional regulator n=2 Tax=Blautia liquoris TaxID=2779518 RepID=A0A7M2RFN8_9FIRM|nr:helix-turn-helix transcriptional regulator [Blautia liquoris]
MYEIFEKLLKEKGITAYRFCKDTGVSSSTISTWKKKDSKCGTELAEIIADYFGVTIDYVLTGKETDKKELVLTPKDERDIKKKLDVIMKDIKDQNDGPLYYNGEEVDPMSLSLLENALESAMKQLKIINKEKYNPNKNKK